MATQQLDELCYLTAQSLTSLETSDHFRVIKLLGEGSYGKVMLAVHRKRGTPMALKFFPRGSTSLLSFLREYNLSLTFCTHPSLTRALGIFFSTPSYYVFAQQPGLYGDLYDVIVGEVAMGEECVQRVVSQLSGAISHLHSLGFVHRDIKPENIFLCDSACRWVKLGDFGLARAQGTLARAVWYDSPFCVPEVEAAKEREDNMDRKDSAGELEGCDSVDVKREGEAVEEGKKRKKKKNKKVIWITVEPSIDSWALGILVYCMLTGCFPWEESTTDDPSYRKYKEWFERETDREERSNCGTQRETEETMGKREDIMSLEEGKTENDKSEESDPNPGAPQFAVFSPLALTLFRQLLNPNPEQRAGPDEALGYLGGAWLLETEKEEKRRMREAEEEARKIREGGGVGEEKEREGRGER